MGQISFEVPGPGTYSITADPTLAPLDSPGAAADVLTGKQFYKSDNTPVTGTMPNNPPEAVTIEAGGSYTIPQGYHSGTGTVTSQGTALPTLDNPGTAADLLAGKELIDAEGEKVTGTMANNGAVNETLNAGDSYTIPAGYHNGSGSVAAASLSSQTPGTADAGDIVSGQTAWVNGEQITGTLEPGSQIGDATATADDILVGETAYVATGKVTGTMPNNNAVTETLDAGAAYTIPVGYHNGQGTVTANSLASQTQGTATAEDIMQGETAWVNGQQITGTATPGTDTSDATATADQILSPYTAYVASGKATGTIPTNTDDDVTINGGQVSVGAGYYANAVSKAIPTVAQAVPSITVSETGLITATATQDAGYVAQGTESATQQLPTQGAQTITPTTTAQTIESGVYLTGAQTIQGDANLVSANIRDGVSIFGVNGTYGSESLGFTVSLIVTVESGATVTAQNGDTTLTAKSSGTATFTIPVPGEWTVFGEFDDGRRTNTITVSVPATYSVELESPPAAQVFGVAWDTSNPSTQITRLSPANDPTGLATVTVEGNPTPAIGAGEGLSPFDTYAPWSEMYVCNLNSAGQETAKKGEPEFSYSTADVMVWIPEFYYYTIEIENIRYFYISTTPIDDFKKHPGSGRYISRYTVGSGYQSITGVPPLSNISRTDARTGITGKGTNWFQYDFATYCAVVWLYIVEFADWDSQTVIGQGVSNASAAINNGGTDSMTYHTGRAAGTDGQTAVQYRGIENLWGNLNQFVEGFNALNRGNIYICTDPSLYADYNNNFVDTGLRGGFYGYSTNLAIVSSNEWSIIPNMFQGSDSTYIPDYSSSSYTSSNPTSGLSVGGTYSQDLRNGLLHMNISTPNKSISSCSRSVFGGKLI